MKSSVSSSTFFDKFKQVQFDGNRFLRLLLYGGKDFPEMEARKFIADHFIFTLQVVKWYLWSLRLKFRHHLYIIVIIGTKYFMKYREPFSLIYTRRIWNFLVAAFHFVGMLKVAPEVFRTINNHGLISASILFWFNFFYIS